MGGRRSGILGRVQIFARNRLRKSFMRWKQYFNPIEALTKVQLKYDDVLDWREELPSSRGVDHHIHLKEGEGPVNLTPYRYAHS